MAVTTKLNVDIGGFKTGMQEAQNSVKTLDAALKKNEAQFKATGNAEEYMSNKANLLNQKMQKQEQVAKGAANALAEMNKNGVDPASKEYQKLAQQLLNAEAAMMETQASLNELSSGSLQAADSADKLAKSVGGISKKISLDQVISGINSITGALEKGAGKAKDLGEIIWNEVMTSAKWADDTATMALMYGIDLDTFQRMQKLVQNGLDTSVDAILNSQTKLKKGIGGGNEQVLEYMRQLGLLRTSQGKYGETETLITEDTTELFWETGRALMAMADANKQEAASQALFGRSWKELIPLFTQYKSLEEYNAALAEVNVNSEEDVERLAEMNDKLGELQGNFQTLKTEVLAELAPALTGAAESLNGLLESLMDYLKTPEGQQMLDRLGTAVSGLFDDLGKIDPEKVVEGFVGVFEKIVGGLEWLMENKDDVIDALKAIVIGWGTLKLTGGALEMLKLVNGMKDLMGIGGNAAAAQAGKDVAIAAGGGIAKSLSGFLTSTVGITGTAALLGYPMIDKILNGDMRTPDEIQKDTMQILGGKEVVDIFEKIQKQGLTKPTNPDWRPSYMQGYEPNYFNPNMPVTVEPVPVEDSAEKIAEDVGTVEIPCVLVPGAFGFGDFGGAGGGGVNVPMEKANGIWSVPYDGYLARLHRNEQVVPAREVSSRNFSSNLYVESMVMNNGADAAGLAAAMAAEQKRTMAGFGS